MNTLNINNIDLEFDKEKFEKVLRYLNEFQLDIDNNKNNVLIKITSLNERINALKKELKSVKHDTDINYALFSPTDHESSSRCSDISNKIINYGSILEDLEKELNLLLVKESNIDEVKIFINSLNQINCKYVNNFTDFESKECDEFRINILEYQEIDRKRIARDLHDTTVQNLTNMVHKTELCSKLVDIDTTRVKLELQTMIGTIRNTINELRTIIYDLRPMSLDDLGLVVTIQQYVNKLMIDNDLNINFSVENDEVKVISIINLAIFRVVQEACSNVIKHAKAKNIDIKLIYSINYLDLYIDDDGVGFNIDEKIGKDNSSISNFGLSIMKERIYLLSGTIDFVTNEGRGTKIHVKVPMFGREENESN